jgi:hypothetical protein
MTPLDQELNILIQEASQHPPSSFKRRIILNRVATKIQKSGRLYKSYEPFSPDAESRMWIYFIQNVCEATTAKNAFDPSLIYDGSVITWLNVYLKRRLEDERTKFQTEQQKRLWQKKGIDSDEALDPIDRIESTIRNEIEEPNLIDAILEWVETDPDALLCQCHSKSHPQVSCKYLIAKRLPPETEWKVLSQHLNTPVPSLSNYFQRHCIKPLQNFCRSQGFHD